MKLDLRKAISAKRPSSERPRSGKPAAPKFLTDLYGDLRDRRLLLPIVALVAAIIAVPMLLSSSSEPSVPLAPPPESEEATAVTPAVVVESAGVRNYQKRLVALKRTNPFDQQFTAQPESASVSVEDGGDSSVAVDGTSSSTSSTADSGATTSSSSSVSVPSSSDPSVSVTESTTVEDVESGGTESETTTETVDEEPRLYTGSADITFGPTGDAKRYKGVKRFEMLPNEKRPVIAFLGISVDAERAYFLVASDVSDTSGDGHCSPEAPAPCEILALSIDDQRTLTVEATQTTYRLRLTGTQLEPVADPSGN
jgi:hypothetical protein